MVKFPSLLALADEVGAEFVATGHYARTGVGNDGRTLLLKGMPANDQSYMLARLPQNILQRVIFPLGNYDKSMVRNKAREFGIPVAEKPDSMEICFIPGDDYGQWLEDRGQSCPPGDFLSPDGRVLGKMGHSERIGPALYRNVPGNYDMGLFRSAAKYFK